MIFAIFLAFSAVLPWGYTDNVSVTGLEGDGLITISVGLLAFLLLFVKRVTLWISLILGIIGSTIGLIDLFSMKEAVQSISGHVGPGIYMTVLFSFGIMFCVLLEIAEERGKKLKLFYVDEDK